jgi:HEPN domain-containing protein
MVESQRLFDEDEFDRWFNQAENTLSSSNHDLGSRDNSWSCFKAQQAGNYALKALLRGLGRITIGHSVLKLLEQLEEFGSQVSEELKDCARSLDKHYVPARYPNAYPAGSPFEFYDEKTARGAIECASMMLNFVQAERKKNA